MKYKTYQQTNNTLINIDLISLRLLIKIYPEPTIRFTSDEASYSTLSDEVHLISPDFIVAV